MMNNPIGILVDNFHLDIRTAVQKAAELGAKGIQFGTDHEMSPEALSAQDRQAFKTFVNDLGMEICALVGTKVRLSDDPDMKRQDIDAVKQRIELALDMGARVVSTHIGVIPSSPAHPRYRQMRDIYAEIADYASSRGACYAIETGPEASCVLGAFLDDINSNGLGVNLDPANLVMITGENPASAVMRLGRRIVHTHIKDGRMNWFCDPDIAYGLVPDPENKKQGHRTQTPLGQGQVPWRAFLNALKAIGYTGYLTIEREGGENREEEIRNAYATLKNLMSEG